MPKCTVSLPSVAPEKSRTAKDSLNPCLLEENFCGSNAPSCQRAAMIITMDKNAHP
ncbi:hypothetical protein HY993_05000 [Candidatus Micrarchaeota archaeon]|nr:hypothetical protein [Candidatus Micrarchaeota archaeon]